MYAVEFDTKIQNGIVTIPDEYHELKQSHNARIVIMISDSDYNLKSNKVKTKSFSGALKQYSIPSLIDNEKEIAWGKVADGKNDIS